MAIMDRICSECFIPLASYVWEKKRHRLHLLDRDVAQAGAVILCWRKFGNYEPSKGQSMGYFYQTIWNYYQAESKKLAKDPTILESDLLEDDY